MNPCRNHFSCFPFGFSCFLLVGRQFGFVYFFLLSVFFMRTHIFIWTNVLYCIKIYGCAYHIIRIFLPHSFRIIKKNTYLCFVKIQWLVYTTKNWQGSTMVQPVSHLLLAIQLLYNILLCIADLKYHFSSDVILLLKPPRIKMICIQSCLK